MKQSAEILAPAGSPDALLAAIESGADAVYLGLKKFNARGNAVNFSAEDLASYVPLAHAHHVKVYLTLNTVVKMNEMDPLLEELATAADCGIDGVILQDLGLARTMARHFPGLRRHASTQMAIHNLDGVRFCVDQGFQRVVLARELTLAEIQEIREAFPPEKIELEVFCHGAMCYTYSGMCFFSGSVGGRSGNRGECAYTCRKGYKILNETHFPMAAPNGSFHNYLFSMKDMNTLDILPQLLESGVDSLKIEGRRKGPSYVSASVQAYRNGMAGKDTEKLEHHLKLAFGREYTKAFYKRGQYGDAPVDTMATGTKGIPIGTLNEDGTFVLEQSGIQRYDGIRLVRPDRGEETISFRDYRVEHPRGVDVNRPPEGAHIRLNTDTPAGTKIMWVRSQDVELHYQPSLTHREVQARRGALPADLTVRASSNELQVTAATAYAHVTEKLAIEPSRSGKPLRVKDLLFRLGDTSFREGIYSGPDQVIAFAPLSRVKQLRRDLFQELAEQTRLGKTKARQALIHEVNAPALERTSGSEAPSYIFRIDRPELLEQILPSAEASGHTIDFLARPTLSTPQWRRVLECLQACSAPVRLSLPMVLRKWDTRVLRARFRDLDASRFHWSLANPGHFPFLKEIFGKNLGPLHADFSIYHLNTWAWRALNEMGIDGRFTLSLEDDRPNMEALLAATGPDRFEAIAYTDTPLFVAEACSLAALYGGCPGAKACGHETLHIENEHGDQFQVRHDRCRSTVIGEQALSWSGRLDWFKERGVRFFRADFTTRDYTPARVNEIMASITEDRAIVNTHTENLDRVLL